MNNKSKWIWKDGFEGLDLYCDFYDRFEYSGGKVVIKISADSNYALHINGKFVDSGQYADYPQYKIYDEIDVSEYCQTGTNGIAVTVWHYGKTSLCYFPGKASLRYEVEIDENLVAYSDENTLCRASREYESGLCKQMTSQMGFSFHCDLTGDDGWRDGALSGFENAAIVDQELSMSPRPVKKLLFGERSRCKTLISEDGKHFLYDIGYEEAGYLTFKLKSKAKQKLLFAYGEHIQDGCVRRIIRDRDFSVEVTVGEGESAYMNPYRRLGLRYLEVFAEEPIEPEYITVTPVYYPINKSDWLPEDALDRKIYEVCVRTLELCMHEHYEDCPWREQALYCMDSRNQMLCGYYCFEEYEFARASLKLMSKDDRYDGLLSLCFPAGNYGTAKGLSIPSFSLHYYTQMKEYMTYSGDVTLAREAYPKLLSIMKTFTDRIEGGCVKSFTGREHWNFYEWTEGLKGHLGSSDEEAFEAALNCLLIIALRNMAYIANAIGEKDEFSCLIPEIREGVRKRFFNPESELFYNREDEESVSELVNSLAILADVTTADEAQRIAELLASSSSPLSTVTLSMLCFKYDALLKVDNEKYKSYILVDIRKKYKIMLDEGATTFWETEVANKSPAGSLCHGWSALPVYYYEIFRGERRENTSALY